MTEKSNPIRKLHTGKILRINLERVFRSKVYNEINAGDEPQKSHKSGN